MSAAHPQMQAILDRAAKSPGPPLSSLAPEAARALDAQTFDAYWNADPPSLPSISDHRIDGPAGPIRMRLYDPGAAKPAPCLIYIHGGGWVLGGLESHDRVCRELAIAGQTSVAAIDYRLAPEHKFPKPLEDCIAAANWIAAHGPSLRIDPERLVIGGDSAGGNLALATLLALRDGGGPGVRAGLLVYGMFAADPRTPSQRKFGDGRYLLSTEDTEWFWSCYLSDDRERDNPRAVPLQAELRGLPPLYIAAAELDPLLDDSVMLAARLTAAGQPHRLRLWEGLAHGAFQMSRELEPMRGYIAEIGAFLKSELQARGDGHG
jgi:acetyl esterase/lipase